MPILELQVGIGRFCAQGGAAQASGAVGVQENILLGYGQCAMRKKQLLGCQAAGVVRGMLGSAAEKSQLKSNG
jgi:hypothetical protein